MTSWPFFNIRGGSSGADERLGDKVVYAWLYPNLFLNRYGRMMDTNVVMPLGPDRCEVVFDFYFEERDAEEGDVSDWGVKRRLRKDAPDGKIDYVELVDAESLERIKGVVDRPALLAAAVFFGTTRLIDNLEVGPE